MFSTITTFKGRNKPGQFGHSLNSATGEGLNQGNLDQPPSGFSHLKALSSTRIRVSDSLSLTQNPNPPSSSTSGDGNQGESRSRWGFTARAPPFYTTFSPWVEVCRESRNPAIPFLLVACRKRSSLLQFTTGDSGLEILVRGVRLFAKDFLGLLHQSALAKVSITLVRFVEAILERLNLVVYVYEWICVRLILQNVLPLFEFYSSEQCEHPVVVWLGLEMGRRRHA